MSLPTFQFGMKQKRPGHKKPIYESISGDDLHRASGQWNKLTREIDRENNRYKEVIVSPETGEILRHCDEPLTETALLQERAAPWHALRYPC